MNQFGLQKYLIFYLQTLNFNHIITSLINHESTKHNKHINTSFTWKTQAVKNHSDNHTHNMNIIHYNISSRPSSPERTCITKMHDLRKRYKTICNIETHCLGERYKKLPRDSLSFDGERGR